MAYTDRITLQDIRFMDNVSVAMRCAFLYLQSFKQCHTQRKHIKAILAKPIPCDFCRDRSSCRNECRHFEQFTSEQTKWKSVLKQQGYLERA